MIRSVGSETCVGERAKGSRERGDDTGINRAAGELNGIDLMSPTRKKAQIRKRLPRAPKRHVAARPAEKRLKKATETLPEYEIHGRNLPSANVARRRRM
jgi:hypothetical protein